MRDVVGFVTKMILIKTGVYRHTHTHICYLGNDTHALILSHFSTLIFARAGGKRGHVVQREFRA